MLRAGLFTKAAAYAFLIVHNGDVVLYPDRIKRAHLYAGAIPDAAVRAFLVAAADLGDGNAVHNAVIIKLLPGFVRRARAHDLRAHFIDAARLHSDNPRNFLRCRVIGDSAAVGGGSTRYNRLRKCGTAGISAGAAVGARQRVHDIRNPGVLFYGKDLAGKAQQTAEHKPHDSKRNESS